MLATTFLLLAFKAYTPSFREQFKQTDSFRKSYVRWDRTGSTKGILAPSWRSPLPEYLRHDSYANAEYAEERKRVKVWQHTKMTNSMAFGKDYLVTFSRTENYARPGHLHVDVMTVNSRWIDTWHHFPSGWRVSHSKLRQLSFYEPPRRYPGG